MARVLRTQGYTVLEASDGHEALTLAQANGAKIQLLLTDVIMPGLSGKTLAEWLGQVNPGVRVLFISGYINNNAVVKQVLTGSARYAEAAMITEIPDGTFGIKKWYPVNEAFFAKSGQLGADESANVASWFGEDQIVFTPDPSSDWWEVLEGTYPIPRSFTITKDMMQQIQSLEQAAGPFSYATLQDDPVSIKHLAGDTFLPIIKVPGAVFNAIVKFT